MISGAKMVISLVLGAVFLVIVRVFEASILRPRRLRSGVLKQGIRGPVPSLMYGNIHEIKRIAQSQKPLVKKSPQKMVHDWFPAVFPHLEQWRNEYGECISPVCFNSTQSFLAELRFMRFIVVAEAGNVG